jgi:hypothetical protein
MPSDEAPRPVRSAFLPIDFGGSFVGNLRLLERRMQQCGRFDAKYNEDPLELVAHDGKLSMGRGTYPPYLLLFFRYCHARATVSGPRSARGRLQSHVMYNTSVGTLGEMAAFFAELWQYPGQAGEYAYVIAWLARHGRFSDERPLAYGLR